VLALELRAYSRAGLPLNPPVVGGRKQSSSDFVRQVLTYSPEKCNLTVEEIPQTTREEGLLVIGCPTVPGERRSARLGISTRLLAQVCVVHIRQQKLCH